ncbi:MAG TPA: OmpW family outer membrane protein [Candidatus Acidoferrales bacterium]|nr:OmpW family outer membrane protein [Candidatus Acidoferrales bacterium]
MRKIFLLLTALTILGVSNAQSQTANVPSAGNKAILFNFTGLGTISLTNYVAQYGIGMKYFMSDAMALRGMLLFGYQDQITNGTPGFKDATLITTNLGLGGALEYHLPVSSKVSPYLGVGAFFMTGITTSTPSVPVGATATSNKSTSTTVGAAGLLGVEYFFNQNISLGAEYQLGLAINNNTPNPPGPEVISIGIQTFGLTLGVYF